MRLVFLAAWLCAVAAHVPAGFVLLLVVSEWDDLPWSPACTWDVVRMCFRAACCAVAHVTAFEFCSLY